ncbi:MAG: hypothetical protein ACRYFR_17910 [Janthinobacterium lividum]
MEAVLWLLCNGCCWRVATRYDKLLDAHFLAFAHLDATVLWLRDC